MSLEITTLELTEAIKSLWRKGDFTRFSYQSDTNPQKPKRKYKFMAYIRPSD